MAAPPAAAAVHGDLRRLRGHLRRLVACGTLGRSGVRQSLRARNRLLPARVESTAFGCLRRSESRSVLARVGERVKAVLSSDAEAKTIALGLGRGARSVVVSEASGGASGTSGSDERFERERREPTPTAARMLSPRQASVHPTATDTKHRARSSAAASVRDHTRRDQRVRRHDLDDTRAQTGRREYGWRGLHRAGVCLSSVESFIRHSAYDFGEPVIATVISSQAISRSRCRRRSIHQSAGCHPATMRTAICRTLTTIVTPLDMRPLVDQDAVRVRRRRVSSRATARRRSSALPIRGPPRSSPSSDRTSVARRPSERTRLQCGRTDSQVRRERDDCARAHGGSRRWPTTNLTSWMLAQTHPRGEDHERRRPPGVGQRDNRIALRCTERVG